MFPVVLCLPLQSTLSALLRLSLPWPAGPWALMSCSSLSQDFNGNRAGREEESPRLQRNRTFGDLPSLHVRSEESQVSGHRPQALATRSARFLGASEPGLSKWPKWTRRAPRSSAASTLCPHHTASSHASEDGWLLWLTAGSSRGDQKAAEAGSRRQE